jgi:hypothetical protein
MKEMCFYFKLKANTHDPICMARIPLVKSTAALLSYTKVPNLDFVSSMVNPSSVNLIVACCRETELSVKIIPFI